MKPGENNMRLLKMESACGMRAIFFVLWLPQICHTFETCAAAAGWILARSSSSSSSHRERTYVRTSTYSNWRFLDTYNLRLGSIGSKYITVRSSQQNVRTGRSVVLNDCIDKQDIVRSCVRAQIVLRVIYLLFLKTEINNDVWRKVRFKLTTTGYSYSTGVLCSMCPPG